MAPIRFVFFSVLLLCFSLPWQCMTDPWYELQINLLNTRSMIRIVNKLWLLELCQAHVQFKLEQDLGRKYSALVKMSVNDIWKPNFGEPKTGDRQTDRQTDTHTEFVESWGAYAPKNVIFLKSTQKRLLESAQDGISRPLGSREIQQTKVYTVLVDTL